MWAGLERKDVLTFMATAQHLADRGILVRIEIELDPDEEPQRVLYALPRVKLWIDEELPEIKSDGYVHGALNPSEQAESLFYDVVSGKSPLDMAPKCMKPDEDGVWELRTHDLRFFGFFWRKGVFVMTSADTKAKCIKVNGLASGHRNNAIYFRGGLDLDEPKFVPGSNPNDVL